MERMQVPIHMCPEKMFKSLGGKKEQFSDTVLMCGQRHRVDMVLDRLEKVKKIFGFSGYSVFRGLYQGHEVMVANSGMYAPDTAIVMELLLCAGVETFIRLGSCGALNSNIKLGDIVLSDSAICGDGTSPYYIDKNVIPQADRSLLESFEGLLRSEAIHLGPVWTTDALFREVPEVIDPVIEQGAIAVDMVSSIVLSLAQIKEKKAISVLAVSDVVINGLSGFKNPAYKRAEEEIINAALSYLKLT